MVLDYGNAYMERIPKRFILKVSAPCERCKQWFTEPTQRALNKTLKHHLCTEVSGVE